MNKNTPFVCLSAALLFLCILASANNAEAFCVYNKTDVKISVNQKTDHEAFKGFSEIIKPGHKGCCSWKEKSCNKEGHADSHVRFEVYVENWHAEPGHQTPDRWQEVYECRDVKIKAKGHLTVKGSKDTKYWCE